MCAGRKGRFWGLHRANEQSSLCLSLSLSPRRFSPSVCCCLVAGRHEGARHLSSGLSSSKPAAAALKRWQTHAALLYRKGGTFEASRQLMYKSVINDAQDSAKGIVDQVVPRAMAGTSESTKQDR